MAFFHTLILIFLIVCLVSIVSTILHLYISKKKQKEIFDSIYDDMKILKTEIEKIKKII